MFQWKQSYYKWRYCALLLHKTLNSSATTILQNFKIRLMSETKKKFIKNILFKRTGPIIHISLPALLFSIQQVNIFTYKCIHRHSIQLIHSWLQGSAGVPLICIIRRKQTKTLSVCIFLRLCSDRKWTQILSAIASKNIFHTQGKTTSNIIAIKPIHPYPDQTMQLVVWNETCSTHIRFNLGLFSFTVQVFVTAALHEEALLNSVMAGHSPAMPLECTT